MKIIIIYFLSIISSISIAYDRNDPFPDKSEIELIHISDEEGLSIKHNCIKLSISEGDSSRFLVSLEKDFYLNKLVNPYFAMGFLSIIDSDLGTLRGPNVSFGVKKEIDNFYFKLGSEFFLFRGFEPNIGIGINF